MIFAYSWARHPETTSQFGAAFYDHLDELKRFPYMGSPAPRRNGVRLLVHTPLLVYYRVHEADRVIEVLDVRHSARRPRKR